MPRLIGVDIPNNKLVEYALCYLCGIGLSRARQTVKALSLDPRMRAHQLSEEQIAKIVAYINENNWLVEGDLRREQTFHIKRLQAINCYRGIRHKRGLPVRGQRTSTNARTRKGKRKTIGVARSK
jgi:small subunit ribosomal protein S13